MKHRRVLQGTHAASAAAMVTLPRSGAQVGGPNQRLPQREAKQPEPAVAGQLAPKMPLLLLIISLHLSRTALLIHFGKPLCLRRLGFFGTQRAFSLIPLPLHALVPRHKSLAHLGTDGESKESPKFQRCRYLWIGTKMQRSPQHSLVCFA